MGDHLLVLCGYEWFLYNLKVLNIICTCNMNCNDQNSPVLDDDGSSAGSCKANKNRQRSPCGFKLQWKTLKSHTNLCHASRCQEMHQCLRGMQVSQRNAPTKCIDLSEQGSFQASNVQENAVRFMTP